MCAILHEHFKPEICEEAVNGQEAIARAGSFRPDIVILDINMPVMDGFAVAKELQRILPGVPILFLTMHSGDPFASEARRAGVQGFVTKDRAGTALVDAVKALLNNGTFFQ